MFEKSARLDKGMALSIFISAAVIIISLVFGGLVFLTDFVTNGQWYAHNPIMNSIILFAFNVDCVVIGIGIVILFVMALGSDIGPDPGVVGGFFGLIIAFFGLIIAWFGMDQIVRQIIWFIHTDYNATFAIICICTLVYCYFAYRWAKEINVKNLPDLYHSI